MPLDRPDRFEIIDAVIALLDRDVKPELRGALGYHLRIAIGLLRLLRRELEAAPGFDGLDAEGLAALVPDVAPEARHATLCARIRDGAIPIDDPRLVEHLRKTTLAKLAIDNPKYPSLADVRVRGWSSGD